MESDIGQCFTVVDRHTRNMNNTRKREIQIYYNHKNIMKHAKITMVIVVIYTRCILITQVN